MKHFYTLIKLKKREVDVLRKQLGHLSEQRDILQKLYEVLEHDLRTEIHLAENLVSMGAFFGDYADAIKHKQQVVNEKIYAVDKQMDIIAEKMRLVFGEQKTYEIVLERKKTEQRYKRDQREQQFMDELSSRNHGNA
jgi:flagellar export protein FliJ